MKLVKKKKRMLRLEDRAELTGMLKKVQRGCSKGEFELFKLYVDVYTEMGFEITPFNKYLEQYRDKYEK